MSYTKFGEMLRIKRIQNHEVMGDLAEYLGVSVAFLSAVETGKKNIPDEWEEKLVEKYNFNEEERTYLKKAIIESKPQIKINLVNANAQKRELAVQFQRSFDNLDDEMVEGILRLLNKEE